MDEVRARQRALSRGFGGAKFGAEGGEGMRVAMTAAVLAMVVGCTSTRSITRGIAEPSRMVEVVLSQVPVGTPIEDAQRFMEREGFKCSRTTNGHFLDRKGLDYVYCDRTEASGWIDCRWQVAIVHRDGKVAEVLASYGLTGP
jgi:hypothetical protein